MVYTLGVRQYLKIWRWKILDLEKDSLLGSLTWSLHLAFVHSFARSTFQEKCAFAPYCTMTVLGHKPSTAWCTIHRNHFRRRHQFHSDHFRQVLSKQVLARLLINRHLAFTKALRYFCSGRGPQKMPPIIEHSIGGAVVLLHSCTKPHVVLEGLVMFFNSMNLDSNHGGRHFGSRFLIFFVSETSSFTLTSLISTAYV